MTDIEQYVYDSGLLARVDMLRDAKFRHLGVEPLWNDVQEAWEWFSEKFLDEPTPELENVFRKGWDA